MFKEPYKEKSSSNEFISVLTGLAKFIFWCMFLYHVGILHLIYSCFRSDREIQEETKNQMLINSYLKDRWIDAEKKMQQYGKYPAMDYFTVLHRMNWLQDSLDNHLQPLHFEFIFQAMMKTSRNGLYSDQEFDQAQSWCEHQPKFHGTQKAKPPHVCNKYIHTWTVRTLPNWFWHIYWHMLPYVFLLLLIWVYEKKDSPTLSLRSPLSFIILIAMHPVYIQIIVGRAWKAFFREFSAGVELRRRKENIFEKFSHEEREAIRTFARNAQTLTEFTAWASRFGERKHIAFIAIFAMLICNICIRFEANASSTKHQATISCVHIQADSVDTDVGHMQNAFVDAMEQGIIDWQPSPPIILNSSKKASYYFMLLSQGYPLSREPVPIVY